MKVAVYSDLEYRRDADGTSSNESFLLFMVHLRRYVEGLTLVGRLDPQPGRLPYAVPEEVGFTPLAHYESLTQPLAASAAMARSLRRCWALLGDVDAVWLLGPHPLAIAFALLGALRGRRVVLGTRQDMPAHMRSRHPGRRGIKLATAALEAAWRLLGRRFPTVVVGPELARKYSGGELVEIVIPLVDEEQVVSPEEARRRSYEGELTVLSVGRVEPEKNPLLLVDVIERLRELDPRWRLVVCGEGSMSAALAARVAERGLEDQVELRGFLALDAGLRELYRSSHAFLHLSFTEGVPQVLFESYAACLPVVATAVGGVPEIAADAALLIPPADRDAAVDALVRIRSSAELRERLVAAGLQRLDVYSLDEEAGKVAALLTRT